MASNSVLYRCSLISFQYTGAATVIVGRRTVAISGNGFRACTSIRLSRNCCSCSNPNPNDTAFVVADDEKYGNKQIISLTPRLYDYILSNVREPEVSPDQAQLLAMLVQILGAKRCIELGVYTGYSSLAVALVLPDSACLVACERDAKSLEVAKKYYELAGVSHKVDVKHGMAADVLNSLILNGESCSFFLQL
ncbi:CATECHOL O-METHYLTRANSFERASE DOMAIN-CONTAINING PROTEIN 1 [Salix purpurea]|uniref:CATECHOL O-METHYLTRANSFERASE DOMAIN-CONTAINING PROTEIN 1 n=1 Tax=Salix purpurea TaxID=77065 RepID=A0A9Q0SQF3_SALPP|nr:CATECHOL O-METHYLTRANSFERASE DOMAIN-CONTAINING PROTEIN 1 [Salix purpurea]